MCGRSLCLEKGWKIGLRRRYALRERASTAAVGMDAGWRRQQRRVGWSGGGTRRVFVKEREELFAEGVRVRTGDFTPETGGRGTLQGGTAHGASGLGKRMLGQHGWMR